MPLLEKIMKTQYGLGWVLIAVLALTGCQMFGGGKPDYADQVQIDRDANAALQRLYANTPEARQLGKTAKGILVFPGIVKAGFIGGGQYGKGALLKRGRTAGYYNMVAGSYGLQAAPRPSITSCFS
jgi:lipid-binding SYLF domain-containing protein